MIEHFILHERKKWIPKDNIPSSTSFICPYCNETVHFSHGSTSKSRRNGVSKRCLYDFCPWCGEPVEKYAETT